MHACNLGCAIPMASSLTTVGMLLSVVGSISKMSYLAWRWWSACTTAGNDDLTRPIEGAAVSSGEIVPASTSSYY